MELAMQLLSTDKTVKSIIKQDLKPFNSQSLTTRVETGEQLVSKMPFTGKSSDSMGYDIMELSSENETLN